MRLIKNIQSYFRALLFDFRFSHCRREADHRRATSGLKHLVIVVDRRPVVVSKPQLKQFVRDGMFRKDVTTANIEAKAIYRTI